MPIIHVKGTPSCPLCGKKMREVITRKGTFFVCTEELCMISINKKDPCCGKWQEKWPENAPECPLCHEKMVWFFRSDRYTKIQCRSKSHRFFQIQKGDARAMPPLKGN